MSGKFSSYISIFFIFPENMLCFDSGLYKYLLSLGNQAFSLNPEAVVLHACSVIGEYTMHFAPAPLDSEGMLGYQDFAIELWMKTKPFSRLFYKN